MKKQFNSRKCKTSEAFSFYKFHKILETIMITLNKLSVVKLLKNMKVLK